MHPHPPLPAPSIQDFRLLLDNAMDYAIVLLNEAGMVREWSDGAMAGFIQKPFTVPTLLSQVLESLEPVRQMPK